MRPPRVLVAGVGNVFLGDDGFGVEVAQRLLGRAFPPSVRVADFGIRGLDLAFALEQCEAAIVVDATQRGNAPGTLYVIEPEVRPSSGFEPHGMTPDRVLGWLGASAVLPRMLRLVGCEPETFGPDGTGQVGLSTPVRAAVPDAVRLVETLVGHALEALHADA